LFHGDPYFVRASDGKHLFHSEHCHRGVHLTAEEESDSRSEDEGMREAYSRFVRECVLFARGLRDDVSEPKVGDHASQELIRYWVEHNTKYSSWGLGGEDQVQMGRSSCVCNNSQAFVLSDIRPMPHPEGFELCVSISEETSVQTRSSSPWRNRHLYRDQFVS
jgi:hypothetical protein